jgi:transcriptional regulator with GAF, ATPase, and Fis domain
VVALSWYRVLTRRERSSEPRELAHALQAKGLVPGPQGHEAESGVVLVSGAEGGTAPRLEEVIRSARRSRVLVALLDEVAIDPWALLGDGVEDVVRIRDAADVDGVLARLERWAEVDEIVASEPVRAVAVGTSPAWTAVLREVVEVARFTSVPVLLTGETGTGKEVLARLVHELDRRPDRPLVLLDCTTIVPSLSGSELFGHERGAFTGATTARTGAVEMADGGTLFLDEIGELSLELQAAVLRVVQEGVYKPVGGSRWRTTSFRLVAATNRDLWVEQNAGRFRADLYFRLAAVTIQLPPLRERRPDILPLFRHFLVVARPELAGCELVPEVAELLSRRDYPGNVRDLRQLAVRVAHRHVGHGPITPGDVPPADRPARSAPPPRRSRPGSPWEQQLQTALRAALSAGVGLKNLKTLVPELATQIALEDTDGPAAAASLLGVSRRALDYRRSGDGHATSSLESS